MARYTNVLKTRKAPDALNREIADYLQREGFGSSGADGGAVWKKGMGLLLGPQYVKFEAVPGELRLEAWTKFALLPGLYLGEMGTTGALGAIPKKKLRARVEAIEKLAQ